MDAESLIDAAQEARALAYAPYSKFAVGAALLADTGEVFVGCNVENISFGLTICAERAAVAQAVASGCRRFRMLAIITDSISPAAPCGACRQVLAEFSPELDIVTATMGGARERFSLRDLLPNPTKGILDSNV